MGRALGADLRRWRERAGLESKELARALSWSSSKVSNMESGSRGVSEVDAAMYLAHCRAPGTDIQEFLEFFHEQDGQWLQPHGRQRPDELRSLVALETTAAAMCEFQVTVIPGLLQTEDYTRALITGCRLLPEDAIEPRVRARKERQALLRRYSPPWCRFFVHESALRLPIGGNAVMNDQLLHLVFASSRPHIDIRVVPIAAGPHGGVGGAFTLMEYEKAKPVVYLEHDVASVFLDRKDYVAHYRKAIASLRAVALDEGQSRSLLAQLASENDRPREDHDECIRTGEPPLA